jgi:hypothetical protein
VTKDIEDIPDLQHHDLAKRRDPPDIRISQTCRVYEIVECQGLEFKIPFDARTVHE